jgi:hypothetical protein
MDRSRNQVKHRPCQEVWQPGRNAQVRKDSLGAQRQESNHHQVVSAHEKKKTPLSACSKYANGVVQRACRFACTSAHQILQGCAGQVVFLDVQVCHGCLRQRMGKVMPRLQRNCKVLAHIDGPNAAKLQDFCELDQLAIQHPLQAVS